MAKKIALMNMKGGVGKSTLAVNLAHHLAGYSHMMKKVLIVDLDPQFNASQYILGYKKMEAIFNKKTPTAYHIFEKDAPPYKGVSLASTVTKVVNYTSGGIIDIIPSQLDLAYTLKNPGDKAKNLKNFVSSIESNYDFVIYDCAPTDSILTEAAYLASDFILIPVRPEFLSSIGIPLLIQSINDFKGKYPGETIEIAGIVFNATENYTPEEALSKEQVAKVAKKHKIHIFEQEVSYSRSYPKGAREGKPIFHTSYARYVKQREFLKFTEALLKKVGV